MKALMSIFVGTLLLFASYEAVAQSGEDEAKNSQQQMELRQLQAQMDAMLEEVNELQSYRTCAEKGKVFKPQQTQSADADGCVAANTANNASSHSSGPAKTAQKQIPQSQKHAQGNIPGAIPEPNQNRPKPPQPQTDIPKKADNNGSIASTAKTFQLPSAAELSRDMPISKLGQDNMKQGRLGQRSREGRDRRGGERQNLPELNKKTQALSSSRGQAKSPSASGSAEQENFLGNIPAKYPNKRVKDLIETAVNQALEGKKPNVNRREGKANSVRQSQEQQATPESSAQAQGQAHRESRRESHGQDSRPISSQNPSQKNAPKPSNQPKYRQAHKEAVKNLVPNCREGEFLTTVDGQVMCQKAASAGKMACPPSTLRVYVGRLERHMHYSVNYTPHGQEQESTQRNHKITVSCQNGDYRLQTITRHECGGRQCHPSKKPAYSQTFYCHKDDTGRCYAKQNGRLVNHSFMEAAITKQY